MCATVCVFVCYYVFIRSVNVRVCFGGFSFICDALRINNLYFKVAAVCVCVCVCVSACVSALLIIRLHPRLRMDDPRLGCLSPRKEPFSLGRI